MSGLVYLKGKHITYRDPQGFSCCSCTLCNTSISFQAFFFFIGINILRMIFPCTSQRVFLVFTASGAGPAIDLYPFKCIYKSEESSQFIPAFSLCDGSLNPKMNSGLIALVYKPSFHRTVLSDPFDMFFCPITAAYYFQKGVH